ncbi:MAG: elongation factor G [Phycisphaerales bacterium]|nr:elongation factor G [Phycisphaerales bacterium]
MADYTTADIRNIAFAGHAGVGKTTLIERILADAKIIGRAGAVEEKNTVCDFDDEEKEHGHSLNSSLVHFDHTPAGDDKSRHINLIDTPGSPDFLGQTLSVLPAVEAVAVVIDAVKGIETMTRRVMKVAGERSMPRLIVINKIDHDDVDLDALVTQIRESFSSACLPINLPDAQSGADRSVVDVFAGDSGETTYGSAEDAHTAIIEQTVEVDDALMEKYLEGEDISPEELHAAFEKGLREGHIIPICFTSSRTGGGVAALADVFAKLCPSPLEGNAGSFTLTSKGGEETPAEVAADAAGPALAHVFKVTADPFMGKVSVFRVHQGTVRNGSQLLLGDARKPLRLNHLFKLQGKEHENIEVAVAGDIAAVAKIDEMRYGGVLRDESFGGIVSLQPIELPRPMYGLAIEAAKRGEEEKISTALSRLSDEETTLAVERRAATGQTVLLGLGELHLRVILEKLKNRFHVEVVTMPPKVAFNETISAKAEGHHRHKKQTGGAGQFGEVYLRVEPYTPDSDSEEQADEHGLLFEDATVGGSVPRQFMPAIEKGIRQALHDGCVAGYPLHNVKVSVYDGKHHPVDSKEVAFVAAGKKAFIDAVHKAKPVLMEPYVDMEITIPSQYMGDVASDISGKRGRIQGTDVLPGDITVVKAQAPLAELSTYQNSLKSMTGGQGSFTMEYSHDEQMPPNLQAEVVAAYKPKEEED